MILKNTELKKLVSNCLEAREREDNCLEFLRFTDKQLELYNKQGFLAGSHCNPCICFDFIYEGKEIAFDFLPIYKSSRRFLSFDLYEDDRMVYTLPTFTGTIGQRKFHYEFSEKKKRRVRIFLPFSCGVEINNFTLDDGAAYAPTPAEDRKKILILGDSITHGYDSDYTSASYAATVATHYDAVVLNQAVGGYYFCADMIDEELPFSPDAVTVAYGTNDWGRYGADEQKYRDAAKGYIDKLCSLYPDARIFGILPLWRASANKFPERMPFSKVYDILTEYYSEHPNVTIIDGRTAVPNDVHFFTDGLHPNSLGQAIYAKNVIYAMEKAGFHK